MRRLILFMIGFFSLMAINLPLIAGGIVKPGPKIVLNPTELNVGDLADSGPVTYRVTVDNVGESLLRIYKIKYY